MCNIILLYHKQKKINNAYAFHKLISVQNIIIIPDFVSSVVQE